MSTDRALLLEALQAMTIQSPAHCAWFGRKLGALPRRTRPAIAPEVVQAGLVETMRHQLYESFYCQGHAVPQHDGASNGPGMGDAAFVQALSCANSGQGSCEPGWTVRAAEQGRTIVEKAGLHVRVRVADVVPTSGGPLVPGAAASLPMPKELRRRWPGFYTALGDQDLETGARGPIIRLYWNLRSQGAPLLLSVLTRRLRAASLPYRIKVLNTPASFTRCDAAVLYVHKRDYPRVMPIAHAARIALAGDLKPLTPALTKQLAPGLSLAEQPPDGESFGLHRCTVLAEAIIQAYDLKLRSLDDRVRVVAARFEQEGLDLAAPFLNPGSTDVYDRLPT